MQDLEEGNRECEKRKVLVNRFPNYNTNLDDSISCPKSAKTYDRQVRMLEPYVESLVQLGQESS